ncbi:hypothetical protein BUALT_Bualt08G0144900 [Buddleja alternifolia]|uniref:LysM domain-containing protein n=1 Tax=Buddleja alternifolia TaxID=168488 RepID=A0AAV6X7M8_9LAMI|nr:hypothetical protein BUALT_Bualt08G0144900 [Buddleja alternifolia]
MELKLSQSSLPTTTSKSSSFSPNHLNLLAQRWNLQFQRISWKGQNMSKSILVHVVKEGETLTWISKLYDVPILDIAAANKDIVDVNLVFEGQHLNIPSAMVRFAQVAMSSELSATLREINCVNAYGLKTLQFYDLVAQNGIRSSLGHHPVDYHSCIMAVFQNRIARNLRNRAANKSGLHHGSSNSMRWRTLLDESTDAESQPDSDPLSEDQERLHFEDVSHAYTKLDDDYQKFLTECGMSKWGYWRGGSPE